MADEEGKKDQEEGEDYYDIRLSFRPEGSYSGQPGVEQFIMDKTGGVRVRQVLEEPAQPPQAAGRRRLAFLLTGIAAMVVGAIAVGVVLGTRGDANQPTSVLSAATDLFRRYLDQL